MRWGDIFRGDWGARGEVLLRFTDLIPLDTRHWKNANKSSRQNSAAGTQIIQQTAGTPAAPLQ